MAVPLWGFTGTCRVTSPLYAELMAIKVGFQVLQRHGCMRVVVESDSSDAVQLINGFPDEIHPHLQLVLECKRLHRCIWSSSIIFIPRNYNSSAYCISKLGHYVYNNVYTVWFDTMPTSILEEVRKDNIMY